MWQAHSKTA